MIAAGGLVVHRGGREALSGVDAVARTGRVTGVVGPNGSGKSTLVRTLVGALRPTRGSVEVDGVDVSTRPHRWLAQRVAFVGQHLDHDSSLTVAEEVALGARTREGAGRRGARPADEVVVEALEQVGLTHLATRRTGQLSGGERQRCALARAFAQGAAHAVLDEPTNHLDVLHQLQTADLLRRIAPTVLVVLHDLDLARRTCDDVLLLHDGRVRASGPAAEVLDPQHLDAVYGLRSHAVPVPDGTTTLAFRLPHPGGTP